MCHIQPRTLLFHYSFHYTTGFKRVQVSLKTSTNIQGYLDQRYFDTWLFVSKRTAGVCLYSFLASFGYFRTQCKNNNIKRCYKEKQVIRYMYCIDGEGERLRGSEEETDFEKVFVYSAYMILNVCKINLIKYNISLIEPKFARIYNQTLIVWYEISIWEGIFRSLKALGEEKGKAKFALDPHVHYQIVS